MELVVVVYGVILVQEYYSIGMRRVEAVCVSE